MKYGRLECPLGREFNRRCSLIRKTDVMCSYHWSLVPEVLQARYVQAIWTMGPAHIAIVGQRCMDAVAATELSAAR